MFTQTFARLVIFALGAGALLSTAKVDPKQAKTPKIEPGSHSLTPPPQAKTPFAFQRLDHIVIRAKDHQKMLDFYVGVLGAEADWIGRFDGSLSHIRIGKSLIDLQSYDAPAGRPLHAGGLGLAADAPVPPMDPALGTLDHFAINMAPRGARVFSEISGASRRRRGDDADIPRSRDATRRRRGCSAESRRRRAQVRPRGGHGLPHRGGLPALHADGSPLRLGRERVFDLPPGPGAERDRTEIRGLVRLAVGSGNRLGSRDSACARPITWLAEQLVTPYPGTHEPPVSTGGGFYKVFYGGLQARGGSNWKSSRTPPRTT